jgi:uncharacterized membrane protein
MGERGRKAAWIGGAAKVRAGSARHPGRPGRMTMALRGRRGTGTLHSAGVTSGRLRVAGRPLGRMPARTAEPGRWRWFPAGLGAVMFVVYSTFSLVRHWRVESTGYDLGIFDQAVRAYAELRAPVAPIKGPGFVLLGDHFHPILVLLAPFYRLWPDVRLLLLAQASLVAVSVVPVGRLAVRRLGGPAGAAVTVAYALSWGVQGLVAYDFHEVAFAVPMVAAAMVALAEERWRAAVAWTLPLLAVKEDLGVTVAAVGCYLCLRRRWVPGTALVAVGLGTMLLVLGVVIPAFNPNGVYPYWGRVTDRGGPLHVLLDLPVTLVWPVAKLALPLALAGVVVGAALRSPLFLVAVPTLAWRLASDHAPYWSIGPVHYNALLMPIAFVALVDAIPRLAAGPHPSLRGGARAVAPLTLVIALAAIPLLPFRQLVTSGFWYETPRAEAVGNIIRRVPDGARVASSNHLAPQLTDRAHVILFPRFTERDPVDWVVVDTSRMSGTPAPPDQQEAALRALPAQRFREVAEQHGIVLFRRG